MKEHLDANDLHYHECDCNEEVDAVFIIPYSIANCTILCAVQVSEDDRRICVSVSHGMNVFPNRITEASEFVLRASLGLPFGTFWLNPDSGCIGFAAVVPLADVQPTDAFIGTLIGGSIQIYHKLFPAMCQVLYAAAAPKAALEATEEGPSEDEIVQSLARLFEQSGDGEQELNFGDEPEEQPEAPETTQEADPQESSSDNQQESSTPSDPDGTGETIQHADFRITAACRRTKGMLWIFKSEQARRENRRRKQDGTT